MKTALLAGVMVIASGASAFAQNATIVVNEVVYVRQTTVAPVATTSTQRYTANSNFGAPGTKINHNGNTIRYVIGTSREAGRQKFAWQQ